MSQDTTTPRVNFRNGFKSRKCELFAPMQDMDSSGLLARLYEIPWVTSVVRMPDRFEIHFGASIYTADAVRARLVAETKQYLEKARAVI